MQPALPLVCFACCTLAACAALSGLDQIQESYCVPSGCSDASASASPAGDATQPSAADVEAPALPDATPAPNDSGPPFDPTPDATVEAEASDDGSMTDAPTRLDASPLPDAPDDAPVPTSDASDDAGCHADYFHDSFAGNANGWTLDANWSIASECAAPPAPQKGNPDPTHDHTGAPGSGVLGAFVCGNNPAGPTTPFRYATSPVVNVASAVTLKLGFWRWLNTDASDWMASTLDVYDGSAWVNVYTNPTGAGNLVTDAAWTYETVDVTPLKNAAFQVRFGYSIANASVYAMSAWNVDDLTLTGACQ